MKPIKLLIVFSTVFGKDCSFFCYYTISCATGMIDIGHTVTAPIHLWGYLNFYCTRELLVFCLPDGPNGPERYSWNYFAHEKKICDFFHMFKRVIYLKVLYLQSFFRQNKIFQCISNVHSTNLVGGRLDNIYCFSKLLN